RSPATFAERFSVAFKRHALSRLPIKTRKVRRAERVIKRQIRQQQCALVRCIFGNPFRASSSLEESLLVWNGGLVGKLAESTYENRELPSSLLDNARLAVLADALEEAGADDPALLGHLRDGGPHCRGCHVVDLLLNKE